MSAIISPCGKYRYRLERALLDSIHRNGSTAIIMVNPSTADATEDDTTIRKLKGFAREHGWSRIVVGNLFAYRATDVKELGKASDPVGPDNDEHLAAIVASVNRVIFAWGPLSKQPKYHRARWRKVDEIARSFGHEPLCIATAKCGHPCHPLMLPYDSEIMPWSPPA